MIVLGPFGLGIEGIDVVGAAAWRKIDDLYCDDVVGVALTVCHPDARVAAANLVELFHQCPPSDSFEDRSGR